jgi:hypothetical protein
VPVRQGAKGQAYQENVKLFLREPLIGERMPVQGAILYRFGYVAGIDFIFLG